MLKLWKICILLCLLYLSTFIQVNSKEDLPFESSLRIGIKRRGTDCSLRASEGDTLVIHYVGEYYVTNIVFDSSKERQKPLTLVLGEYLTMLGLERGLIGSCVGDIRKITIPRNYTSMGEPDNKSLIDVDRDQTLVYTVEVLEINPTTSEEDDDDYDDGDEDKVSIKRNEF